MVLSGLPAILRLARAKKRGELALLTVGVLAILIVLYSAFKERSVESLETIEKTVEQVNSRLTLTSLQPGGSWIGDRPRASYLIASSSGHEAAAYLFDKHDYLKRIGRDPVKIPTRNLCELAMDVRRRRIPIIEGLRDSKLTVSLGEGLKWEAQLGYLAEVAYSITELVGLRNRRVEILVRGYADGQRRVWDRPLDANPTYQYKTIEIYPPLDPLSESDPRFREEPVLLQIGDRYDNVELPNLRAEFVRRDLLEPYLQTCPAASPLNVRVLKGHTFSGPDQPDERKVQIHINLY